MGIISSQNSSLLNLLNFFIIIGKLYLWDCRRDQRYPDLQRFKVRLKMKYEIERFISLKNNINNDNFFQKEMDFFIFIDLFIDFFFFLLLFAAM